MLHVLPKGFIKIRHHGLFAAGVVHTKLAAARSLLARKSTGAPEPTSPLQDQEQTPALAPRDFRDDRLALTGLDLRRCRRCGALAILRFPLDAPRGRPPLAPARGGAIARQVGLVLDAGLSSAARAAEKAEIAKGMSAAMRDEIGPGIRAAMRDQVAPGLAETLKNEELQRALGVTAHNLGREMVLGVTEALAQQKPAPEAGSLLSSLSGLAQKGAQLFGSAAWLLMLVIVALFAWIVKLLAQARRYREDADRRAANALGAALARSSSCNMRPLRGSLHRRQAGEGGDARGSCTDGERS